MLATMRKGRMKRMPKVKWVSRWFVECGMGEDVRWRGGRRENVGRIL